MLLIKRGVYIFFCAKDFNRKGVPHFNLAKVYKFLHWKISPFSYFSVLFFCGKIVPYLSSKRRCISSFFFKKLHSDWLPHLPSWYIFFHIWGNCILFSETDRSNPFLLSKGNRTLKLYNFSSKFSRRPFILIVSLKIVFVVFAFWESRAWLRGPLWLLDYCS